MYFSFIEHFPQKLRDLRTSRNLTMEELGEETGATKSTISNFENANRTPSIDMLIKLADYFNVSIDYLVGRTEDPILHQKED